MRHRAAASQDTTPGRREEALRACREHAPGAAWWVGVLDGWSDLALPAAYGLAEEMARIREGRGERWIGYKLGCTSGAVQQQLGTGEPIYAPLFEHGRLTSGDRLSAQQYANLAVEGELALRLTADLCGADLSDVQLREAIGSVFPVIELHHLVLPVGTPRAAALAATGGLHAGMVLPEVEAAGRHGVPDGCLLRVSIDGRPVGVTHAVWTMGSPTAALRWLAVRLAERGQKLRRGQIILTGSPLCLFPVRGGNTVLVEAPPLGSCGVEIVP